MSDMTTTEFYQSRLQKRDSFLGTPLYDRPKGFDNIQWVQRVYKILTGFNCLNISGEVPDEDDRKFAARLSNETELPFELFKDMYERYVSPEQKKCDQIMYENPDAVGILMDGKNGPEPFFDKKVIGKGPDLLDQLNYFGKAMTNGF